MQHLLAKVIEMYQWGAKSNICMDTNTRKEVVRENIAQNVMPFQMQKACTN